MNDDSLATALEQSMGDREWICTRLRQVVERFPFRRIVFGYPDSDAASRSGGMACPRLDLIVSGSREITLGSPTGPVRHHLTAGDAYYVLPYGRELYQWNTAVHMLCVVPHAAFTRVSYYDQPRAVQPPPVPVAHHTDRPCSPAMRATVDALNALAWQDRAGEETDLARALVRLALHECRRQPAAPPRGKRQLTFDRIQDWLEHCFAEDINRETTARQFGITPSYLSRLFHDMGGVAFHQHLTDLRIAHARSLLLGTDLTIREVGDRSGFPDPVHFTRRFRQAVGVTPGTYRSTGSI
jgi:AraC-like DNA-binding protein